MSDFSFDKSLRLLNAGEFKRVFDDAQIKVSSAEILLLARPNGLTKPRLGLVIAKKNAKLAVTRNKIKRLARDSFRLCQKTLGPIDIVLLTKRGINEIDPLVLRQMLDQLWDQLGRKARRKIPAPPSQHD